MLLSSELIVAIMVLGPGYGYGHKPRSILRFHFCGRIVLTLPFSGQSEQRNGLIRCAGTTRIAGQKTRRRLYALRPASISIRLRQENMGSVEAVAHDKTSRSVSETEEMHRLARVGGDSSHAILDHITVCPECRAADDPTAS